MMKSELFIYDKSVPLVELRYLSRLAPRLVSLLA